MNQVAFQSASPLHPLRRAASIHRTRATPVCNISSRDHATGDEPYDAIVIGAGLGGLSTAALLTTYGRRTLVLEAHTTVGGAAQAFTRRSPAGNFTFEAGPHLFSGLSEPSRNPLSHVLAATDAKVDVISYDAWGIFLADDFTATKVRKSIPFLEAVLQKHGGPTARSDMNKLIDVMRPLGVLATQLPPALLRADDAWGSLRTMLPRMLRPDLLRLLPTASRLSQPFAPLLDSCVKDTFTRNFVNLLCFLLAGVEAERIPVAEVAFMFHEWIGNGDGDSEGDSEGERDMVLQHPIGGAAGLADALASVVHSSATGSKIQTKSRVTQVIVHDGRAVGVQLASGKQVFASNVVSNVSALDVPALLPDSYGDAADSSANSREMCDSFMHLNFTIRLTDSIRDSIRGGTLLGNYVSVEDWALGMEHPDNVVLMSIPSVLDPAVCPKGYAIVHAYTPATEPFAPWQKLEPGTAEYAAYKEERSSVLWRAVNRVFGCDVASVAEMVMVGTPKTHAKFLNRRFGSYGPRVDARVGMLGLPLPSSQGFPRNFLCVGDGVFPGIGVPAVAGSAWLVANGLVSIRDQEKLLEKLQI